MLGIFLDTETNGLNPHKHCVLEIAYKMINVQTGMLIEAYEAVVAQEKHCWEARDPQSLLINGFSWEMVSKGIPAIQIAQEIIDRFTKCGVKKGSAVFICQNPSFDRAFFSQLIDPDIQESLNWPYHWLDLASMFWASHIQKPPHPWVSGVSKDKIAEVYQLPPEAKPHRAMNGVNHLLECYEAVVGFPTYTRTT